MAQNAIDKLLTTKGSCAPGAIAVIIFLLLCLANGGFFARGACAIGSASALTALALSLIGIRRRQSNRPRSSNATLCLLVCAAARCS